MGRREKSACPIRGGGQVCVCAGDIVCSVVAQRQDDPCCWVRVSVGKVGEKGADWGGCLRCIKLRFCSQFFLLQPPHACGARALAVTGRGAGHYGQFWAALLLLPSSM